MYVYVSGPDDWKDQWSFYGVKHAYKNEAGLIVIDFYEEKTINEDGDRSKQLILEYKNLNIIETREDK